MIYTLVEINRDKMSTHEMKMTGIPCITKKLYLIFVFILFYIVILFFITVSFVIC